MKRRPRSLPAEYRQPTGSFALSMRQAAPEAWMQSLALQLSRFEESQALLLAMYRDDERVREDEWLKDGILPVYRLGADCHWLLIGIRHALEVAKFIARSCPSDKLSEAIGEFSRKHADAKHARDIHEHLVEYVEGGGNLRARFGDDSADPWFLVRSADDPSDEVEVFIGSNIEFKVPIKAVTRDAISLLEVARIRELEDAIGGDTGKAEVVVARTRSR